VCPPLPDGVDVFGAPLVLNTSSADAKWLPCLLYDIENVPTEHGCSLMMWKRQEPDDNMMPLDNYED
jgi:hypothetical protein